MHWVRWDKVLAPKDVGGLGVGNFFNLTGPYYYARSGGFFINLIYYG